MSDCFSHGIYVCSAQLSSGVSSLIMGVCKRIRVEMFREKRKFSEMSWELSNNHRHM